MTLVTGARLGPYEILAPLGAGGMGEVYKARDTRLLRDVAIKVLPEELQEDEEALARFEREARAIAALSHPNILAIHDFGREDGISYSVTELLEGETLRMALSRGPLPPRRALEIGAAVAEGLSAAHSRGIVHRDVKPDNVFLTSHGLVKILDFGLVRHSDPGSAGTETAATTVGLTTPGIVLGTIGYMSPEQVRGERADAATDIFALGCVLYEMLTGSRAFDGATAAEAFVAVLRDEPAALMGASEAVPAEVVPMLRQCLKKTPAQRYQTARDLAFALRELASGTLRAASSPAAPIVAHAPKAEAYQLYLKGRHWWNRRPESGFLDALDYFQKSIEADPSFALSYSGLADCYIVLGGWESGILPPNEAFLKARTLARKALELDDRSAESHATLGYALFHYDWNFEQAERGIQKAIALNPGYAAAHHWYSHLLLPLGRILESMQESLAAVAIDPVDFIMNAHLAWHHYFAGDYDHAIEAAEKPIVSKHFWSPFFSGLAYEQKGMLADAIDRLQRASALSPDSTYPVAALAHARALAGDRGRANRMLADLRELSRRRFVPSYDLAVIHLGLGEVEEALELLERALDERSSWLIHLNVDPRLAPLRTHSRFLDLVRRVGLRG